MKTYEECLAEIEQTEEYKVWKAELIALNNHINGLKVWDDYAERCQAEYDFHLFYKDPRKKVKNENRIKTV